MTVAIRANLPLMGTNVLVTRSRTQAGVLTALLERHGATVIELPAIEISPVDSSQLDAAIAQLTSYEWIVFTSSNGVDAFVERLRAIGEGSAARIGCRVAAIGKATAERLKESNVRVDLVPQRYIAESVVEALVEADIVNRRVLLPQGERARDVIETRLRDAGADVEVVVAYRTVMPAGVDVRQMRATLAGVDVVTFASPSSVRNTIALAGGTLPDVAVVCIGPVTADAAREAGLTPAAVAEEYSSEGLVEAVIRLVTREQEGVPDVG